MQKCFNGTKQRKRQKTQEGDSTLHIFFPLTLLLIDMNSVTVRNIQNQNVL